MDSLHSDEAAVGVLSIPSGKIAALPINVEPLFYGTDRVHKSAEDPGQSGSNSPEDDLPSKSERTGRRKE